MFHFQALSRGFRGYCAQISDLQNYVTINVCCFKPLNLWLFILAAIENQYRALADVSPTAAFILASYDFLADKLAG